MEKSEEEEKKPVQKKNKVTDKKKVWKKIKRRIFDYINDSIWLLFLF